MADNSDTFDGQTVWCRTATGEWWKTTAAGPKGESSPVLRSSPTWRVVPVYGWDRENPSRVVNWPAADVQLTDPEQDGTASGSSLRKDG